MTTAKTNRPITVIHSFCTNGQVAGQYLFCTKARTSSIRATIILPKSFFVCLRCIRHTAAMIYPSIPPFRVSDAAYDALIYFFLCKRRPVPFYDRLSPVEIKCIIRHQLDKLVPPFNISYI